MKAPTEAGAGAHHGKMTREPPRKSGKKNSGTWKLDSEGFCTTWK